MIRRLFLVVCSASLALTACEKPASSSVSVLARPPTVVPPVAAVTPPEVSHSSNPAPEAAPVNPLALPSEGKRDHVARARQLQTEGDLPGALAEARRALSDNATDEEALILIGRLGQRTRSLTLSAQAYERLAGVDVEDAMPLVEEARLLVRLRRLPEARDAATRAAERDAQSPEVHQVLGRVHLEQGTLPLAIAEFERVLELEPDHGYALNNLGLAYLRANENEKAVEVLERASEKLPLVAYVMNNYGVALERVGRTEEAKTAYREAMDLSPKYVKAMINAQRLQKLARAGTEEGTDDQDSAESTDTEETPVVDSEQ